MYIQIDPILEKRLEVYIFRLKFLICITFKPDIGIGGNNFKFLQLICLVRIEF